MVCAGMGKVLGDDNVDGDDDANGVLWLNYRAHHRRATNLKEEQRKKNTNEEKKKCIGYEAMLFG